MIDFQVAFDRLAQFETSGEIAEFFLSEEIKAIPLDSNNCAVSVWMRRTIQKERVFTNRYSITEYSENMNDGASNRANTTQPIFDFIVNFDEGLYPDLIRR